MSKHIDAMFRPDDEIHLSDAEYLAARGLDAWAPIEGIVEAEALATLEHVATTTVIAERYGR